MMRKLLYSPILILILIFTFWLLLTRGNYFHWDEWEYLMNFRTSEQLKYYIFNQTHEQFPYAQILHHYVLFKIFGLNNFPFQLSTIFFHTVNSLLLYLITFKLLKKKTLALVGMIIFGFSGVAVEAVNNSAAISHVFAGFFTFIAFLFLLKYQETKKSSNFLLSVLGLIISPMGHGITLLEPFAFAVYVLLAKRFNGEPTAVAIYILTGFINLGIAAFFAGEKLVMNTVLTPRYLFVDMPLFVINGVVRGSFIRFFLPELYLQADLKSLLDFQTRELLRTILHLIPVTILFGVGVALVHFRERVRPLFPMLIQFGILIAIGYIAAAPARASFGFNQAIITRYAYQAIFFVIILGLVLIGRLHIGRPYILVVTMFVYIIHIISVVNFQRNFWQPIAEKEKDFIDDINYLFEKNDQIYDLPARGIFPDVKLSRLWFITTEKKITFLSQKGFPVDAQLVNEDPRTREIYKKIINYYDIKTH